MSVNLTAQPSSSRYPAAGTCVVYRGAGFIAHVSPDFRMEWKGRTYDFEWGRYGGPIRLKNDGEPYARQPSKRSAFWSAIEAWVAVGKRTDGEGNCLMTHAATTEISTRN